ncbi:MAG: hypothetical protein ACWA40_08480 [Planktomarina sp.]
MRDLSIAQLSALMHDNLQRSYELIEDLTVLDRDEDGSQKVVIALSEAEVEVPVALKFSEKKVRASTIMSQAKNMSAYELAQLRVDMPTANPAMKANLREHFNLTHAKEVVVNEIESEKKLENRTLRNSEDGKSPADDTKLSELKALEAEISQKKSQVSESMPNKSLTMLDLRVSVLDADSISPDKTAHIGRVTFRFKTTLK